MNRSLKSTIGISNILIDADGVSVDQDIWQKAITSLDSKRGIYLHGKAGRGKSFIAAALLCAKAEHLLERKSPTGSLADRIHFRGCNELVLELMSSFRSRELDNIYTSVIERYCNYDMLVLDDFGINKPTEFVVQAFDMIIDFRYKTQRSRSTIITSNYSLDELSAKYDDRISSRIAGMCDVLEITGDDRRITK